ncbi:MAG: hypothetical protein RLY78_1319 [Pseudomonadota bacterium]
MLTWRLDGVDPLAIDDRIVRSLLSLKVAGETRNTALTLGIVNQQGQLYRIVRTLDLTLYLKACTVLELMGLSSSPRRLREHWLCVDDCFSLSEQPAQGSAGDPYTASAYRAGPGDHAIRAQEGPSNVCRKVIGGAPG